MTRCFRLRNPRSERAAPRLGANKLEDENQRRLGIFPNVGCAVDRFRRSDRGSTTLEFALAGSLAVTMVLAVLEAAFYLLAVGTLESAVRDAGRYGITGRDSGGAQETIMRSMINERHDGFSAVVVERIVFEHFASFGQVNRPEPFNDANGNGIFDEGDEEFTDVNGDGDWSVRGGTPGAGGPEDIVQVRVEAVWHPFTPLVKPLFGSDGMPLEVAVILRNEPFEVGDDG